MTLSHSGVYFALILTRILAAFLWLPLFAQYLPFRLKFGFCLTLALFSYSAMSSDLPVSGLMGTLSLGALLQQLLLGLSISFLFQILFQVFLIFAEVISHPMGLLFSQMIEPGTQAPLSGVGNLYLMMTALIFLGLDGHLAVVQMVVDSFRQWPIVAWQALTLDIHFVFHIMSWVFYSAALISLPALTALLVVNLGFGFLTRLAPQFNLFSLGLPLSLLAGLVGIWLTLSTVPDQIKNNLNVVLQQCQQMVRWK